MIINLFCVRVQVDNSLLQCGCLIFLDSRDYLHVFISIKQPSLLTLHKYIIIHLLLNYWRIVSILLTHDMANFKIRRINFTLQLL